ncbi:hypothetical protein LCGC14_0614670 [marine sediment metagenome]|uniref:Scaffolding protein n=1 Tax=marine sediment metagenome TaxID=412755 RepID=A0A0F9RQW4_9ZZZZ
MADFYDDFMAGNVTEGDNTNTSLDSSEIVDSLEGSDGIFVDNGTTEDTVVVDDTKSAAEDGKTGDELPAEDSDAVKTEDKGQKSDSPTDNTDEKPYDQDPKWLAARAAEKNLTELLAKHGYESAEDLSEALETGQSLKQLLGDKDANELVAESKQLKEIKDYWATQDEQKTREGETSEETIDRLEKRNLDLQNSNTQEDLARQEQQDNMRALDNYNSTIVDVVDNVEGASDTEKAMMSLLLGVNNPANEVDIEKIGDVKKMASGSVSKFQEFVNNIKQEAIDSYAKGQSKITPMGKSVGTDVTSVKTPKTDPNASVEDVFDAGKKELLEMIASNVDEGM